jgi:hypothetical protein
MGPGGAIAYRGRIDNSFAAIAVQRLVVTEHDVRDALDAVIVGRLVAWPEEPAIGGISATGIRPKFVVLWLRLWPGCYKLRGC